MKIENELFSNFEALGKIFEILGINIRSLVDTVLFIALEKVEYNRLYFIR